MKRLKMKHFVCAVLAVVMCVLSLPAMTGCVAEHFDRDDIVEWAQNYIHPDIVVSRNYQERVNDEDYVDHVWMGYIEGNPELTFELVSHKYYSIEWVSSRMETTYYNVYGRYLFEQYTAEHDTHFTAADEQLETSYYRIAMQFCDRDDIAAVVEEMEDIDRYVDEQGYGECLTYCVSYDDPMSVVRETDVSENFHGDVSSASDVLEQEYAMYSADYRLTADQFSTEELAEAVEYFGRSFNITRADGSVVSYPDLGLSRFGYGMSFGTLYEVLSREGFEPEGTPDAFRFTGVDGSEYEFSYWFNDQPYEVDWEDQSVVNGYYYLKDGQRVSMDYYFYNHFRNGLFERMTGMTFVEK